MEQVAEGCGRLPAAVLLAEDCSCTLQAVTVLALNRHRLPRAVDEPFTIDHLAVQYIWLDADCRWKGRGAEVMCKRSKNKEKKQQTDIATAKST